MAAKPTLVCFLPIPRTDFFSDSFLPVAFRFNEVECEVPLTPTDRNSRNIRLCRDRRRHDATPHAVTDAGAQKKTGFEARLNE